jgi:multiple sugar transport system permease protein
MKKKKDRNAKYGYIFITPHLIGFLLFTLFPVISSLFISFTDWNIYSNFSFNGVQNYIDLMSDQVFLKALSNTIFLVLMIIPASIVISLLLAVALNNMEFSRIYRVFIFIPVVTSLTAVSLVWTLLYNTDFGLINAMLAKINVKPVGWLTNRGTALLSMSIMTIWKIIGYNMTIFLAGLQGIPEQLYESADIDGAGKVRKFFTITVPLLGPTTYFITVIALIQIFQIFEQVYLMTGGGPANATQTIVMYLYSNAFKFLKMGYASAIAYVLFFLIFFISLIQHRYSKKWADISY